MVGSVLERPNLKQSGIKTLEFSTELELGTELNNLIKEKGTLLGQAYLFQESYTIARVKHTFTIEFAFSREFSTASTRTVLKTQVAFKFRLTPGGRKPKWGSSPNDIIGALNKPKTMNSFRCALTYDYKKKDKRRFILALPIKLPESPIFPFQIIDAVGIHGKIGSMDYSALVTKYPDVETTHLLIMFGKNYQFNSYIAEKVINDANTIVTRLMIGSGG